MAFYGPVVADLTPIESAFHECGKCGIAEIEVDEWVASVRHSTLNRDGLLRLFTGTFADPKHAAACMPCVEAVLEAAGQ